MRRRRSAEALLLVSRRRPLGLRGRLTAALILTSALTLAVVALALLAPLERRLRSDEERALTATTLAARPTFVKLPVRDVRRNSRALQIAVNDVRRRTGAEVTAVNAQGGIIAASEPGDRGRYADVEQALADDRVVAGIESSSRGLEARVAVSVRRRSHAFGLSLRRPLTTLASAQRVVERGVLVAALVAMALALVGGTLLASRLVGRLRALRDTVLRVNDADVVSDSGHDDGRDEVGDLSRAFAAMQRRVNEQEQARRTFVATASHELRTPLASLQLMLGLLGEDLRDESPNLVDARDQVARATAQSVRLTRLASDLLDLSRLDAAVALREELVELRELTRAVIAEFDGGEEATVRLEPAGASAVWAMGDAGSVAQILRILLDNALRFAPAGTTVTVGLHYGSRDCEISVCDEGPGVRDEDRERIFERFECGGQAPEGRGFGLGLAIGRELAHRMGGELGLGATASPTCFILELPAARVEP